MATNTLTMTEATQTAVFTTHAGNCNLSTDLKRRAVRKVWASVVREKLAKSSVLAGLIRQGLKLADFERCLSFHENHDVKLHSGAGVGMARVAQLILGQTDSRACVPFLINRHSII